MIAAYEVLSNVLDSVILSSYFLFVMYRMFEGCRAVEVILDMAACPVPSLTITGLLLLIHVVSLVSANELDMLLCSFDVILTDENIHVHCHFFVALLTLTLHTLAPVDSCF